MADKSHDEEPEDSVTQERMLNAERLAAVGEVAAGLAHEIRNPVDGMLECMRYLQADPDKSERAVKYYPMLQEGLERIARVMHEMLIFARSGQTVHPEACRAATTLEHLALLVQSHLKGHNVKVHWKYPDGCSCLCDRRALEQAGLNLILNAVDAAEMRPNAEILVETHCDEQWVYLSVSDSGPGVPADQRQRIFMPFYTTKPTGKGTGLGLSVSRQLIMAAGGQLELCAEPGPLGGARFLIRLARAKACACSEGE